LIRQSGSGPRNSKTYELTDAGLAEVQRWLRETEPSRAVRNEALLRVFFLWLLEPDEREAYLRKEADHQRSLLTELERIEREEPPPRRSKERAYRLALERGLAMTRAVLKWVEDALEREAHLELTDDDVRAGRVQRGGNRPARGVVRRQDGAPPAKRRK
jgi:DNA-binding PadR family transcriptional regulator